MLDFKPRSFIASLALATMLIVELFDTWSGGLRFWYHTALGLVTITPYIVTAIPLLEKTRRYLRHRFDRPTCHLSCCEGVAVARQRHGSGKGAIRWELSLGSRVLGLGLFRSSKSVEHSAATFELHTGDGLHLALFSAVGRI